MTGGLLVRLRALFGLGKVAMRQEIVERAE
jgi:hypothetical protein